MHPSVTTWHTVGSVAYGVDADGLAWERATTSRGEPSFFPLGTPAPTWAPEAGCIDVLEVD